VCGGGVTPPPPPVLYLINYARTTVHCSPDSSMLKNFTIFYSLHHGVAVPDPGLYFADPLDPGSNHGIKSPGSSFRSKEVKDWSAGLKDWSAELKDWSAELKDWSAELKDWSAELKDWSAGLKDWSAGLKDWSVGLKDWSAELKDWSAGLKDWSAGLKDWSAGLKDWNAGGAVSLVDVLHCSQQISVRIPLENKNAAQIPTNPDTLLTYYEGSNPHITTASFFDSIPRIKNTDSLRVFLALKGQ
jgi:hypothetical protein